MIFPILSFMIWMPIIFGIIILFVKRNLNKNLINKIILSISIINFIFAIYLIKNYDVNNSSFQFEELRSWIRSLNSMYHVGIDGISLCFIVLTTLVTMLITILNVKENKKDSCLYKLSFLILSGLIIGIFSSRDSLLFYIFFESTLIPMYIMIGKWGGKNRVYASFKFFLYTFFGSLLMLIGFLYLYNFTNTFSIETWQKFKLNIFSQFFIFLLLFLSFAIKIPIFPFHTWLPDAHVEASTETSVILAAIMLKLGAYGFLRFLLPITPYACCFFSDFIIILSLINIIYISFITIIQDDIKKLIAYSSIAHMGFVVLGIFLFDNLGVSGAIIQMISHGLISSAMFLSFGILYKKINSRQIYNFGGIINTMPKLSSFVMLFSISNCSLPGTSGFLGEYLIILSAIKHNFFIAFILSISLIFSAVYMLWMYKRVYFGDIFNSKINKFIDIDIKELFVLGILLISIIYIGIYPKFLIKIISNSVNNILLSSKYFKSLN